MRSVWVNPERLDPSPQVGWGNASSLHKNQRNLVLWLWRKIIRAEITSKLEVASFFFSLSIVWFFSLPPSNLSLVYFDCLPSTSLSISESMTFFFSLSLRLLSISLIFPHFYFTTNTLNFFYSLLAFYLNNLFVSLQMYLLKTYFY